MALILNIETATPVCSVALSRNGELVQIRENREGRSHASLLSYFIEDILKKQDIGVSDLDAVSISKGPGSYTGLRIGVSTAKGLCYGADLPLIALSTLQALSQGLLCHLEENPDVVQPDDQTLLVPMLDARRMEVYSALLDRDLRFMREVQPEIIDASSYRGWLDRYTLVFFGSGAAKTSEVVRHPNAIFIEDIVPSARHMRELSLQQYRQGSFEDVAYFEPFYLKEFMATKPRKNIIGPGKKWR